MSLLSEIHGPEDVKRLSLGECTELASELRQNIIDTVSLQGGHLASNLGVVELTIALHRSFESPKDKLIFDVGHQVYAHKLLTGRQERFPTLRSYGGISGFPSRAESEHDLFDTGHSSTSISMALGLARARDLNGEKHHVVAVVGDGALTGGMCYEAMNDAGAAHTRLIVILNDNAMSISPNVGALSNYFRHLRASASWYGGKKRIKSGLRSIPLIGRPVAGAVEKMKNLVKTTVSTDGQLFEALGFRYLGPFDGHNIEEMCHIFDQAKQIEDMPVLIHVVTKKGNGYKLAERQPEKFHGIAPFFAENGNTRNESAEKSAAFYAGEALCSLAAEDRRVTAVTAAMASGTGLSEFQLRYPDRFFDVGIAEEHAVSMAAGMARGGMRPYFAVYATFLQRAFDQIAEDVALQNLPVCILADHMGLVGDDGKTHHGVLLLPMLLAIPNMTVLEPRDYRQLEQAVRLVSKIEGPSVIAYPKNGIEPYAEASGGNEIAVGKWQMLRDGKDAVLLACGRMVKNAWLAARLLSERGIDAGVVDCCSLKPMDTEMLRSLGNSGKCLVTLEEGQAEGGFGAEAERQLIAMGLPALSGIFGIGDAFVPHGRTDLLLEDCSLSPEKIAERIEGILKEKRNV